VADERPDAERPVGGGERVEAGDAVDIDHRPRRGAAELEQRAKGADARSQ
jgi:hypothetical protein